MKKLILYLLAIIGITSACGQQKYEDTDVLGFAELATDPDVVLLDVRTAEEYDSGHIECAFNIDAQQADFLEKAQALLPAGKLIAVYCRSGRRSANAAELLTAEGYQVVNLKGGIKAWQEAGLPVATDSYEVDQFKTPNGKIVKIHAFMHSSMRIQFDDKEIQIDPVLKLGGIETNYSDMPKADYIFVTHEHGDHLDQAAIETLSDDNTLLITNQRCADKLGYGHVMANGDTLEIDSSFIIEAVPAYNIPTEYTVFHPAGRDNGFVLTLDGFRIYIAGDTEFIPEMSALHDIDVAFLPCNQPYTMTVEQLIQAAQTIKPKVLFPYHYNDTDISGIQAALKDSGVEVRIRHYE